MKYITRNRKSQRLLRVSCFQANSQFGQSLIETIIAIFILTSSLTAGLGLTIYAFSSAGVSENEIVASNLAREGVEIVRGMRDSNWLAGDASASSSYNLTTCSDISSKFCYPKTYLGPNYSLLNGNQRAVFNSTTNTWALDTVTNYNLYLQADGTYTPTSNGTIPVFSRMINITFNSAAPYTNQNSNQEMIVKSVVAWQGRNCPSFASNQDLLALTSQCKIVVEEHMTNWKDYQ